MKSGFNNANLISLVMIAVGMALVLDPKCREECRAIAAHLIRHSTRAIL